MRIAAKPTEQEIIEGPQAVSFQIANGNVRQRCILQTELPTKALAQKYLLAKISSRKLVCYRKDGTRRARGGKS